VNGDGVISSPGDNTAIVFVGQKYFGGLENNFSYKNFEFDFFFQFVNQNKLLGLTMPGILNANQPVELGKNGKLPVTLPT
jgi:hypothetical protein